jgi:DNA-binding transcriptional LysR family regulator
MDRVASMTAFVKVVDCRGFSPAAQRLNLSPTMVTNHVRALEERLGARLLNRTTRKVSLTDVGRIYYERCQQILSEIDEADRIAVAQQTVPRGVLRLNASTAIAPFLASTIAEFVDRYGESSVILTMTDRMVDMVEEGFDLAVRIVPVSDSSLIVRHLSSFRFVVCGAPEYLKKHGTPRQLVDLARHNCLTYSHSPWGNEWHFHGPRGEQPVPVAGNLQTNSAETLRAAAICGQGLVFVPRFLVEDAITTRRLVPVLTKFLPAQFDINAYYPHRHLVSAKVRSFLDLLARHFKSDHL